MIDPRSPHGMARLGPVAWCALLWVGIDSTLAGDAGRLASRLGCSEVAARRALRRLREHGYVRD